MRAISSSSGLALVLFCRPIGCDRFLLGDDEADGDRIVLRGLLHSEVAGLHHAEHRLVEDDLATYLVDDAGEDEARAAEVRSALAGDRLARGLLVSDDGRTFSVTSIVEDVTAEHDDLVTLDHAHENHAWAGGPDKRLVVFPHGDHNTIFHLNQKDYLLELGRFFVGS